MSEPTSEDLRLAGQVGVFLAGLPTPSNPFSEIDVSEEFMSAGPEKPPHTMNEIRTMQAEIHTAIQESDAVKIAAIAGVARGFLGDLKSALLA